MPVARRFAAAFAVVGLGVLAYAVPASATESGNGDGACITNPAPDQLAGTLDAHAGTATVRAKSGQNLCADVFLSAYTVPDSWVGPQFDKTALPQQLFGESDQATVKGYETATLTVALPDCGAVQVDLYTAPEITTVTTTAGHRGQLVKGEIFRFVDDTGAPVTCRPSTPAPTPTTSSPSAPETTAPETSTPAPTPSETPAPTPSGTTPAQTPSQSQSQSTTPAAVVPPATPGPVAPVPTTPAPPATPVLASTGSNATIPLIGIGTALLGLGIGLSLLGRRRRAV